MRPGPRSGCVSVMGSLDCPPSSQDVSPGLSARLTVNAYGVNVHAYAQISDRA